MSEWSPDLAGMAAWANVLRIVLRREAMPAHLSFSAAETWEDCHRKWAAKYVLYVPDEAGAAADIGKMAHLVLQGLGRFKAGRRTDEHAAVLAERAWAGKDDEKQAAAMGHVEAALTILEVSAGDVLRIEMDMDLVLAGVPFKGFLDRADEIPADVPGGIAARVLDYKTGKRPGRRDWMAKKYRQLYLYAAGFETVTGIPVHEGAFVWTKTGKVDTIYIDADGIGDTLDWFRSVWSGIRAAVEAYDFDADPGPLCSWCPVVQQCPEGTRATIERHEKGKSIGEHGQPIIDALQVAQFEDTLEAVEGRHLSVVEDPTV